MRKCVGTVLCFALSLSSALAEEPKDFNQQIMSTVDWLAANRAGKGYSGDFRFTENLRYGNFTFRATGQGKTMCVAAVFETLVRAIETYGGENAIKALPGSVLGGGKSLNLLPYIFQFTANKNFPQYRRRYTAGAGDSFVLFGIGRYVSYDTAKAGDVIYFTRDNRKRTGHAVIFIGFLNKNGELIGEPTQSAGFRYFSAQRGGTNGLGFRDAFFSGECPKVDTSFFKDCSVRRSALRHEFSVSRLHHPDEWFTQYSAIRVNRFFQGETIETIFADESEFRARVQADLEAAEAEAREAVKGSYYRLIVPKIASESIRAETLLEQAVFSEDFGPTFEE